MKNKNKFYILKFSLYTLLLLALYVLQTVPGLFVVLGQKPIWVIPAAIAIAMLEGEFVGGIFGVLAGILCDMGGFSLFGFNAFFIGVFCIAAGLLIIYMMRCNLPNCLLFTGTVLLFRGSIEYLFAYGMWGYENVWKVYVYTVLPVVAYSTAIAPLVYFAVRGIHRRFALVL